MTISLKELTAGQLEPVPELIQPYENFPKKITGPTVWVAEDFRSRTELWQRKWTPELIAQLEEAFDHFEASGKTLPEINRVRNSLCFAQTSCMSLCVVASQDTFPLPPQVSEFLSAIREEVVNGQGFILIEGLPVTEWPVFKSAAIYLAIGTIFGVTLSQNRSGHILGHVKVILSVGPVSAQRLTLFPYRTSETILHRSIKSVSTQPRPDNTSTAMQQTSSACSVCTRRWRGAKAMSSRLTTSGTRFKLSVLTLRNC